jgi:hypothetical protein
VGRTVTSMHVLAITGKTTRVKIAPDGTFLLVRGDVDPFHLAQLVIDGSTGRRVVPLTH